MAQGDAEEEEEEEEDEQADVEENHVSTGLSMLLQVAHLALF